MVQVVGKSAVQVIVTDVGFVICSQMSLVAQAQQAPASVVRTADARAIAEQHWQAQQRPEQSAADVDRMDANAFARVAVDR